MVTPWMRYVAVGIAVVVLVLLFQRLTRGEVNPGIAVVVAIGYLGMSAFVRHFRNQDS